MSAALQISNESHIADVRLNRPDAHTAIEAITARFEAREPQFQDVGG